ncbi:MAG: YkgJ family cysteine cluster protein [Gammaproteobacteria bacterium]|nr:YkgJ family cysteine cluster protein [Gammaproteobacteria bacterium]
MKTDCQPPPEPIIALDPKNKCSRCHNSKCCTYITEALGAAPRSKADFEHLLWQVSHKGISAYKDRDGWFLLINAPCSHLGPGGACAIYDHRPQICRDYDNDWCELDAPAEEGFQLHFRNYDELLKYCRKRFKTWGK